MSPGRDGLKSELYQTFSLVFAQVLKAVFNQGLGRRKLERSFNEGLLILLSKGMVVVVGGERC